MSNSRGIQLPSSNIYPFDPPTHPNFQVVTPEDVYRLNHIFKLLGTRIIPTYFFTQNPVEYTKWQMNACRQTAIIVSYFLNELLRSFYHSPIEITIIDGEFKDNFTSWYNHAWVVGTRTNYGASDQIFIDVARVSSACMVNLQFPYGCNIEDVHPELQSMGTITLRKTVVNPDDWIAQDEYYTGKTGHQICAEINQMMRIYGYDLTKFKWQIPQLPF